MTSYPWSMYLDIQGVQTFHHTEASLVPQHFLEIPSCLNKPYMLRHKKAPLLEPGDEWCQGSAFFNFVILFAEFINKDGVQRVRNML